MTAHMAVPAFEPQSIPATVSRKILTDLLRDELNFKGIIVTDAMEMQGVAALYSHGEAAVRAMEAGADVLLMPTDPGALHSSHRSSREEWPPFKGAHRCQCHAEFLLPKNAPDCLPIAM